MGRIDRATAITRDQHECCNVIDVSAVQFLVEQYPGAVTCTDQMGWIPFHLAALQDAALDVVFYLICQHPGALSTGLPLRSAAAIGNAS